MSDGTKDAIETGTAAGSTTGAPALVLDLARSCVDFVRRAVGLELDFTQDTLSVLDHYAQAARREAKERPEALSLVASAIAAYFGELVRREHSAFWHLPAEEMVSAELRFEDVFLSFSPYAFACAAMGWNPSGDGAEDTAPDAGLTVEEEDRDDVAAHLAKSPPVTDEEYALLTTRLEVIDIVADQLRARAEARGVGDVSFDEADYEDGGAPLLRVTLRSIVTPAAEVTDAARAAFSARNASSATGPHPARWGAEVAVMNAWKLGGWWGRTTPEATVAPAAVASGERLLELTDDDVIAILPSERAPDGIDSFGEPFFMEMDWNDLAHPA